jgi:hypothetical protein
MALDCVQALLLVLEFELAWALGRQWAEPSVLAAGLPIQPPLEPAIEQHRRLVQRKRSRA